MKIKQQFLVLMSAVIMVPIAILSIVIVVQNMYQEQNRKSSGFSAFSKNFYTTMDPDSMAVLTKFMEHRPPEVDLVIFDSQFIVRYTTIQDFAIDTPSSPSLIQDYIMGNLDRYMVQFDRPVKAKDASYLMLRFQNKGMAPRGFFMAMDFMTIALALLLVVASIVSILISRSLANSITRLEMHTRHVAQGNLDYSIPVSGSYEVRSLGESIEKMRLSLKEESARRARLIMGISHDLKTPLALIKGYAEALGDGVAESREEELKHLELIGARADQLTGMVDELIDYVRLDSGEWKLAAEMVPLGEFLDNFSRIVRADARLYHKSVDTRFRLPSDLSVPMDRKLIQRALENLIHNAFRYSGPDARIGISASLENEKSALIEISDNGQGIKPEDLPHIMEPFFRASNSRREPGIGLGLTIVKTLVESHGWTLDVRSKPQDTVFTIRIPVPV